MEKGQTLPLAVLAGILCAGLTVLPHFYPSFVTLLLCYFSFLPLFAVGLSLGLIPLYGATGVAILIIFAGTNLVEASQFVFQALLGPVFLVNRALLHCKGKGGTIWYPSSQLLLMLSLAMGAVWLLASGVSLYMMQGQDFQAYVQQVLNSIDPQRQLGPIEPVLAKLLPLLPGVLALSWGAMMLLNGVLAQGLLVRFKKNLRPTPSLDEVHLHPLFSLAFLGCCLGASLGTGTIGILSVNIACVLPFPLFLVGFSLCHSWISRVPLRGVLLILFYVLLCFVWPAFLVIMVGILKPWIEKVF